MKISELGVLKMLDAIEAWQKDPKLHELTCSKCEEHVNLKPKMVPTSGFINLSGQEGSTVVLECPKCDYVQSIIPDSVYQWYIDTHLKHNILLGQVVEVEFTEDIGVDEIFYGKDYPVPEGDRGRYFKPSENVAGDREIVLRFIGKLRTLVVGHLRDCDGSPIYCLSNLRVKYNGSGLKENIAYNTWSKYLHLGFCEDILKVVEGEFVPLLHDSIFEYKECLRDDLNKMGL